MLHGDGGLAYQIEFILGEQIVNLTNGAGGIVLNGHHAVVRLALFDGDEYVLEMP